MTIDERLALIRQVGEEIVTEDDLRELLQSDQELIAYDGFEPSGQIHIAQGLLRAINVNKMTRAGVRFKMWVADWHAWANNKMDGDLDKIQTVGKYFIEVWKACGMNMDMVEFHWASDYVKKDEYWKLVLQIAKTNTLNRFIRTAEIMGRTESMDLTAAQIIYPCMQTADIFMLGAKITQLGMDQRKVNMLAREVGPQLGYWKPVVVSHHMLMGLTPPGKVHTPRPSGTPLKGESSFESSSLEGGGPDRGEGVQEDKVTRTIALKMSKSNPDSAIFMTDTREDIERKIVKAWAPEGIIEENPLLEYCKYIIFPISTDSKSYQLSAKSFTVDRPEKFGGAVTYESYEQLEHDYAEKKLHPMDLKKTVITILDNLLQPVRKHFAENTEARELLKKVQSYQVTR